MQPIFSILLPLMLAFIMFSLGIELTPEDFRRTLRRPKVFLIGITAQMILLPVIAYVILRLSGLTGELAVGMMILAFCPGGVTTNLLTRYARGDVALSVSMTAVVSMISIISLPLLVAWSVTHFMGTDAPPVSVTSLALAMVLITALPVILGMSVKHRAPELAARISPSLSKLSALFFTVAVLAALIANWSTFLEYFQQLAPALISLCLILFVFSSLLARWLGLERAEARTLAIETSVQNGTVGIAVGGLIAVGAASGIGLPIFSLPSAVYGIVMYLVSLPLIFWLRTRPL